MTQNHSEPRKKQQKPQPLEVPEPEEGAYLPSLSNTVASTECTGLVPASPSSEEEMDSYHELSAMPFPEETQAEQPE